MKKQRYVPDLVADMAECDANYIRLVRLFPHMDQEDFFKFGVDAGQSGTVTGQTVDGSEVTIVIHERCPYTTMLNVKVEGDTASEWVKWPTLEVRVYHDIKSAEVVAFERHRNFKFRYPTPNDQMYQPDEKSQINRYFGELLNFCYQHGHSLERVL